jgi:hypothetical protein
MAAWYYAFSLKGPASPHLAELLPAEDISCPYQGHQKTQFELFLGPPYRTRVIVPQSLLPSKEPEAPVYPPPPGFAYNTVGAHY